MAIRPMHASVVKDKLAHLLLPALLNDIDSIAYGIDMFESSGRLNFVDSNEQFPHRIALSNINNFIDASAVPNIKLATKMIDETDIPSNAAITILTMVSSVRDIASVAVYLHTHFLVPTATTTHLSGAALFGWATEALRILIGLDPDLDGFLSSPAALHIEHAGFKLFIAFSVAREWLKGISAFAHKCQLQLLESFAVLITEATSACRSATPTWEACLESSGALNLSMATKMMNGRLPAIIEAHNFLHNILKSVNVATKSLSVEPRAQSHELTAEPIAIALTAMAATTKVSTLATALDILCLKGDPAGPPQASQFLAAHKSDRGKQLPQNVVRARGHGLAREAFEVGLNIHLGDFQLHRRVPWCFLDLAGHGTWRCPRCQRGVATRGTAHCAEAYLARDCAQRRLEALPQVLSRTRSTLGGSGCRPLLRARAARE